jgi:AcrR family transcriptional regulator
VAITRSESTTSKSSAGQATRERLILTAERLFAERGFEVPARDILAAAEHRNDRGLMYHFGGRDEIIDAIVLYRGEQVDRLRHRMIDDLLVATKQGDPRRIAGLIETLILPLAEQRHVGHFLGFAARLQSDFGRWDRFRQLPDVWESWGRARVLLEAELPSIPVDELSFRLDFVSSLVVQVLAARATREERGEESEAFEAWFESLQRAALAIVVNPVQ